MDSLTIQIECRPITSGGQSFRASYPWSFLGRIHPLAAMLVNIHVAGQVIRFSKGMIDKYFDIRIQTQQIQSRSEVIIRFETPRNRLIDYLFIAAKLGPSMGMVIYYFQMGEIERNKQLVSFYFRYHQCLQSHLYLNFNIPITGKNNQPFCSKRRLPCRGL